MFSHSPPEPKRPPLDAQRTLCWRQAQPACPSANVVPARGRESKDLGERRAADASDPPTPNRPASPGRSRCFAHRRSRPCRTCRGRCARCRSRTSQLADEKLKAGAPAHENENASIPRLSVADVSTGIGPAMSEGTCESHRLMNASLAGCPCADTWTNLPVPLS